MLLKKLQILQNNALQIMNFQPRTSANLLLKSCKILKLADKVRLQNILFAHNSLNNNLPSLLIGQLMAVNTVLSTRSASYKQQVIPTVRTNTYGTLSSKSKSAKEWNTINLHFHGKTLQNL